MGLLALIAADGNEDGDFADGGAVGSSDGADGLRDGAETVGLREAVADG